MCGGGRREQFIDTETDHLNSLGLSCTDIYGIVEYGDIPEACLSTYDTVHFTATELCLACRGGEQSPCSLELLDARTYAELQSFPQECT